MSRLHKLITDSIERADTAWAEGKTPPTTLDGWIASVASYVEDGLTEATGGTEHMVRVTGRGWVMQHPLPERFEEPGTVTSLIDCKFNHLVSAAMAGGAMFDGNHRVWIDRGVLQWEEVA